MPTFEEDKRGVTTQVLKGDIENSVRDPRYRYVAGTLNIKKCQLNLVEWRVVTDNIEEKEKENILYR